MLMRLSMYLNLLIMHDLPNLNDLCQKSIQKMSNTEPGSKLLFYVSALFATPTGTIKIPTIACHLALSFKQYQSHPNRIGISNSEHLFSKSIQIYIQKL